MTPRKFVARAKRHRAAMQFAFMPMAQMLSVYVNAHLKEGAEATTPDQFVPGLSKPKPQQVEHSPENRLAVWESYAYAARCKSGGKTLSGRKK